MHLAYNGVRFHGWQIQPNAITVQEEIQNALEKILREVTPIMGAGRTDTGVHSGCYYAHFNSDKIFKGVELTYKLNKILPYDIVIFDIFEVKDDMHARFSALSRTYTYTITQIKDPFNKETAWFYKVDLDVEKMNKAAEILLEYKDFTSFSKLHTDVNNNNCDISFAKWEKHNNKLIFTISANRFLRNMVRSITGTLINVGTGKTSIEEFRTIIENKDRQTAGQSVDAHGLSLIKIEYPEGFNKNAHV